MALDQRKFERKHTDLLRDVRPLWMRIADAMMQPSYSATAFIAFAVLLIMDHRIMAFADIIAFFLFLFWFWLATRQRKLAFKLPMNAKYKDPNNTGPGRSGKAEGIMYLGNMKGTNEELWFTNGDCRTHILYLGTTGSGKTEGLKSIATNAMAWGSGFVYVDGKADTDLWSSLSSLCRRFGRDDDLLVLNYMTGNADGQAPSNTMNPFSSGSASYLVNMLVQLMPEADGDNAMWKERAVSLVSAMMPVLVWKREHQDIPLSVISIRDNLSLNAVVKLSRDKVVPEDLRAGLIGYLDTLPGYQGEAYDDDGKTKPPGPDTPQYDTTTASQQHGYLAMQFTRALQSLGDDYGYIFDTQAADVDMTDVVLNRRILIVLIPALEKSNDEIANLGKIVSSTLKGMMGSTLGATVEGESAKVIENKPTHSSTPFITIFDEVGYYIAQGMAVMAAQARSLGFCLVFSGQDLPAMKKRVREEANSVTANCNIKIFGKLEDPTETKEFFEKTVGQALVTELSGFQMTGGSSFGSYYDTQQASVQTRSRASYDGLRGLVEGEAVMTFGEVVIDAKMFYSNPGHAKAMRVTRYLALAPLDENVLKRADAITALRDCMVKKGWTAMSADVAPEVPDELAAMAKGFKLGQDKGADPVQSGIMAVVQAYGLTNPKELEAPAVKSAPAKEAAPAAAESEAADAPATPPAPFAKKPDAEETPKDAAPSSPLAKPETEQKETPQTGSTVVAQRPQRKALPKEIQDIISKAGQDTHNALFKDDSED